MEAAWLAVLLALVPARARGRVVEVRSWGGQRDGRLTLADWNAYEERDQDGPGTYSFGYDIDDPSTGNMQYRQEERHANGTVTGSYGLLEPDGNVRVVTYIADHLGYRVQMENSLHDFPRAGAGPRPGWAARLPGGRRRGDAPPASRKPPRVDTEWLDASPSPSPSVVTSTAALLPSASSGELLRRQDDEEVVEQNTLSGERVPTRSPPKRRKHYRARTRVRVSPSTWRQYPQREAGPGPHFQLPPVPLLDPLIHQRL